MLRVGVPDGDWGTPRMWLERKGRLVSSSDSLVWISLLDRGDSILYSHLWIPPRQTIFGNGHRIWPTLWGLIFIWFTRGNPLESEIPVLSFLMKIFFLKSDLHFFLIRKARLVVVNAVCKRSYNLVVSLYLTLGSLSQIVSARILILSSFWAFSSCFWPEV